MNAPSLTCHLLFKDLRHQRVWLAFVWLTALLLPLAATFITGPNSASSNEFILATNAFFLLLFLVLVRLIRLDPPGRDCHFLATRPVSWKALLASKVLFAGLFLLVPVWIAKLGIIYMVKIPVNQADVALLLLENTVHMGVLLAGAVLFSLFLRRLPVIIIAMVGTAVFVAFAADYMRVRPYKLGVIPRMTDINLGNSQYLMFYMAVIATIAAVAIFRYSGKSILKPLGVLIVGLAASIAVWNYWPYDLSRVFSDTSTYRGELPPGLRDHITFALRGKEGEGENSLGAYGMWDDVKYINFNHAVSLEGVEPPYFAVLVDYHSTATLKSGRVIRAAYNDSSMHGATGGRSPDVLRKMAGFPTVGDGKWNETAFEIFHYLPDQYQKEDLTGASIKGELTLEIRRTILLKTVPFKSGSEITMPRRRYVLQDVEFTGGKAAYKMLVNMVVSSLRGDPGWNYWGNDFSWLVFNRAKGECLAQLSNGSNGGSETLYSTQLLDGTLRQAAINNNWKKENEPIPPDWADGAEISFYTAESCGRISFPYEIKSVDLAH